MVERKALITGATGLLGRATVRAFDGRDWKVKGTGFSRANGQDTIAVDLNKEDDIAKALDDFKPQVIVHCAAQRFPDKVDKDPDAARALNVAASKSLASLAATRDIVLIYISTDYVFPGVPGEAPYESDAAPRPTNLYGQTKLDGEGAVLDAYKEAGKEGSAVVLRVPVLYGSAETPSESAVNVLLDTVWKAQEKDAKPVKMDHWAIRYPTNTSDVGRVCQDIAVKYLETSDRSQLPKILQFSSEDKMTKYEICQAFADLLEIPTTNIIANTEGNNPNASVQRPYDCHLSTKALKDLGIDVGTSTFTAWWRRELRAFRK